MTLLKQIIIGIIVVSGISVVYAATWSGPTQSPPGGNVPAPLNIGPADQVKTGIKDAQGKTVSGGGLSLDKLAVFGKVMINDGTQKTDGTTMSILASNDANGTAFWKTPAELGLGAGGAGASCGVFEITKSVLGLTSVWPNQIVRNIPGYGDKVILNLSLKIGSNVGFCGGTGGGCVYFNSSNGNYVVAGGPGLPSGYPNGVNPITSGASLDLALDSRAIDDGTTSTKNSKCTDSGSSSQGGTGIVAGGTCMSGINGWLENKNSVWGGASCSGDTSFTMNSSALDPQYRNSSPASLVCPQGTTKVITSSVRNNGYGGEGAVCVGGGAASASSAGSITNVDYLSDSKNYLGIQNWPNVVVCQQGNSYTVLSLWTISKKSDGSIRSIGYQDGGYFYVYYDASGANQGEAYRGSTTQNYIPTSGSCPAQLKLDGRTSQY